MKDAAAASIAKKTRPGKHINTTTTTITDIAASNSTLRKRKSSTRSNDYKIGLVGSIGGGGGGDDDGDSYHRPRRCNPDTLAYLCSLPLDLQTAKQQQQQQQQQQQHNSNDNANDAVVVVQQEEEEESLMVTVAKNATNEIQHEIASLASCNDERGSQQIELLVSILLTAITTTTSTSTCTSSSTTQDQEATTNTNNNNNIIIMYICKLLYGFNGYHLFLSCHRFGSHVVQTILMAILFITTTTSTTTAMSKEDQHQQQQEYDEENDLMELPSIETLIIKMTLELLPHIQELSHHICASHVIRTLICTLAGAVPFDCIIPTPTTNATTTSFNKNNENVLSFDMLMIMMKNNNDCNFNGMNKNKSKKKKMKKKKELKKSWENSNTLSNPINSIRIASTTTTETPQTSWINMLNKIVECIMGKMGDASHTLSLTCHCSSGPLLSLLVRVLAALDHQAAIAAAAAATTCTSTTINNNDKEIVQIYNNVNNKNKEKGLPFRNWTEEVVDYRLGIYPPDCRYDTDSPADVLVKHILVWDNTEGSSDAIYRLSGELYGSRFLETILCCCQDDVHARICELAGFWNKNVENENDGGRSTSSMATTLRDYVMHDVSNFVIQTVCRTVRHCHSAKKLIKALMPMIYDGTLLQTNRRGVLWRCVEMSAKWKIGQIILWNGLTSGFADIKNKSKEFLKRQEKDKKRKLPSKDFDQSISQVAFVKYMLSIQSQEMDGGKLFIDVNGARVVHNLLRFEPKLCESVLDAILTGYSSETLVAIAKDGLSSRCIMDGILEGPVREEPFSEACLQLLETLKVSLISLSVDRIGYHTIAKLFKALKIPQKKMISASLSNYVRRLGGNSMGSRTIQSCCVGEYLAGEDAWQEAMKIEK